MIFGTEDLLADLRAMGIETGDGVFVHSSLSRIGHVIGGPRGLIEALIKAVGANGLIGMPGFSRDAYDPADLFGVEVSSAAHSRLRSQVPGFDPERSNVLQNGVVAEAFRRWPGIVRSPHPTSSVLLFGPDARDLAAVHNPLDWATGPETPWGKLRNRTAMKILLIGVGWNRCSAFHAAESAASHRRMILRSFKLGLGADARWITAPDVADDLDRLFPFVGQAWEDKGRVVKGRIAQAESRLTDYAALLDFATDWIGRHNQADGVPAFAGSEL